MKYSYRITKYHTYIEGTSFLTSPPEEWLDYSGVGSSVTLEEYVKVESQYIDVILTLSAMAGITQFQELRWPTILTDEGEMPPCIKGDIAATPEAIAASVRHYLRHGGGKLVSLDGSAEVHFGWDFYMYMVCDVPYEQVIGKLNTPLNVEAYRSPHLDK